MDTVNKRGKKKKEVLFNSKTYLQRLVFVISVIGLSQTFRERNYEAIKISLILLHFSMNKTEKPGVKCVALIL